MSTKNELLALDQRIARILLEDPTLTPREVAKTLGKRVQVVYRRIDKMQEDGRLRRSFAIADWEAIGLPLRFRIDIQIVQNALFDPEVGGGPSDHKDKLKTQEAVASFILLDLVRHLARTVKDEHRLHNLEEQLFVEDVTILLGSPNADLCVIVRARSHAAILRFVTSGLRMMRGVSATATYQEAWSCRGSI